MKIHWVSVFLSQVVILAFGGLISILHAQNADPAGMAFYADVMVNASDPEHRSIANDSLMAKLETHLSGSRKPVYFPGNQWVSAITSQDSSLRIYTWQLLQSEDQVSYIGYIQDLSGKREWPFIKLEDTRPFINGAERSEFGPATWYGALYYGIRDFKLSEGSKAFLLTGYHANDNRTNYKIADVLLLSDSGVRFGFPVFEPREPGQGEDLLQRILVEYSDVSSVSMQYDPELELLIFDHVVAHVAPSSPEGPVLVSDGSYEGYRYADGRWNYVAKVFDHVQDTPPRPNPILDERKTRDIFGRDKNNK